MDKNTSDNGKPCPPDSALGQLRHLISENRRVKDGKIITRKDVPDAEWNDPKICKKWEPTYLSDGKHNPIGGEHNKSGMVNAIAESAQVTLPYISAILRGEDKRKTLHTYQMILKAVRATPEEQEAILKRLLVEQYGAVETPDALFASEAFQAMPYPEALEALMKCFIYHSTNNRILTRKEFLSHLQTAAIDDLKNYEPLTDIQLSKCAGMQDSFVRIGKRCITYEVLTPNPLDQLSLFATLGLSTEQAAQMLRKYWHPDNAKWHGDGSMTDISYASLEKIFTGMPKEHPDSFKSRGDLLRELRQAHCLFTYDGQERVMLWQDAAREILKLLQTQGMDLFKGNRSFTLEPLSQDYVGDHLKTTKNPEGISHSLVGYIELGKNGNHPYYCEKYLPSIVTLFNLPPILEQTLYDAPEKPEGPQTTIEIKDRKWTAEEYRENVRNLLDPERPQKIEQEWGNPTIVSCVKKRRVGGSVISKAEMGGWLARTETDGTETHERFRQ